VQLTPRFEASFAIETLINSIIYRESQSLIAERLKHALRLADRWLEAES